MTLPKVAIIGRPNVGKSTLFNRLTGKRLALVDDRPGVTRDRRDGEARLGGRTFDIVDTAGLEQAETGTLADRMTQQTMAAIEQADVCLFMIDARSGLTPMDEHFAGLVRASGKPAILLANKAEGKAGEAGVYEAYALGLGDPIAFSAEHGIGLDDVYDRLAEVFGWDSGDDNKTPKRRRGALDEDISAGEQDDPDRPLRLAVVGRPNAGKSTLINRLVGEERMLTGPEAGITRDAIGLDWRWNGKAIKLWDTAGMRKKARIDDKLEKLSVADGLRAVKFAEVVVILIDATQPLEKQDLTIANRIEQEGRACVVAINKWDLVDDRAIARRDIEDLIERSLGHLSGVPVIYLSALSGRGLKDLMPAVMRAYQTWNRRVSTSKLNRWLEFQLERHPPPAPSGRRIKIRYMTQARTRPPTFAVFCSNAGDLPESYKRYLVNNLRADFDLPGVPIRLNFRQGQNPYA